MNNVLELILMPVITYAQQYNIATAQEITKTLVDLQETGLLEQSKSENFEQYIARIVSLYAIKRGLVEQLSAKGYVQAVQNAGYHMALFSAGFNDVNIITEGFDTFASNDKVVDFSSKLDKIALQISLSSGKTMTEVIDDFSISMNEYLTSWIEQSINK